MSLPPTPDTNLPKFLQHVTCPDRKLWISEFDGMESKEVLSQILDHFVPENLQKSKLFSNLRLISSAFKIYRLLHSDTKEPQDFKDPKDPKDSLVEILQTAVNILKSGEQEEEEEKGEDNLAFRQISQFWQKKRKCQRYCMTHACPNFHGMRWTMQWNQKKDGFDFIWEEQSVPCFTLHVRKRLSKVLTDLKTGSIKPSQKIIDEFTIQLKDQDCLSWLLKDEVNTEFGDPLEYETISIPQIVTWMSVSPDHARMPGNIFSVSRNPSQVKVLVNQNLLWPSSQDIFSSSLLSSSSSSVSIFLRFSLRHFETGIQKENIRDIVLTISDNLGSMKIQVTFSKGYKKLTHKWEQPHTKSHYFAALCQIWKKIKPKMSFLPELPFDWISE